MARGVVFALVGLLMSAGAATAQQHEHGAQPAERLGKVSFTTSCQASVRDQFNRAVALLHSFWYAAAADAFTAVAKADPGCAMAHWGVAMARWGNPLGGTRTAETLVAGRAAVAKARAAASQTPRERGYIAAVEALYAEPDTLTQPQRAAAYEQRMGAVATAHPDDTEAAVFYAIALIAAASPTDQTYARQLEAAKILERVFETQPDHPGVTHYLIHSYDYPPIAAKGLAAARRYASIAPDAPHALHMPSHIFTRVGAWQDSIESNRASAAAAKRANSAPEELHAMDYQVYANLQLARDDEARRLLAETEAILARVDTASGYGLAGVFGASAIPARVALERGDWAEAAKLTPRPGAFPQTEAMTWFARAVGAARSRQPAEARASIAKLTTLRDALRAKKDDYWAGQVEIQRMAAEGLTLTAESRTTDGLALLKQAADMEDKTEKSPITPGPLAPARELYAEALLANRMFTAALAEFERGLTREPGRFRLTAGAMLAAGAAGDQARARRYAADLLALTKGSTSSRPEIAAARKLISRDR
jgi:hypothetical protein